MVFLTRGFYIGPQRSSANTTRRNVNTATYPRGWCCTNNIILLKAIILWFRFSPLAPHKHETFTYYTGKIHREPLVKYFLHVVCTYIPWRFPGISRVFQVRSFDIRKINISHGGYQLTSLPRRRSTNIVSVSKTFKIALVRLLQALGEILLSRYGFILYHT